MSNEEFCTKHCSAHIQNSTKTQFQKLTFSCSTLSFSLHKSQNQPQNCTMLNLHFKTTPPFMCFKNVLGSYQKQIRMSPARTINCHFIQLHLQKIEFMKKSKSRLAWKAAVSWFYNHFMLNSDQFHVAQFIYCPKRKTVNARCVCVFVCLFVCVCMCVSERCEMGSRRGVWFVIENVFGLHRIVKGYFAVLCNVPECRWVHELLA